MRLYCTRPNCTKPVNPFPLLNRATLQTAQQKYCTTCGMPLILSGRYLPEKLLGQGGFGAAFYACDRFTPTQRSCVVKLFQPSSQLSPQQLQIAQGLFEREATVLEKLGYQHPQVPDLYAFFPLVVPGQQLAFRPLAVFSQQVEIPQQVEFLPLLLSQLVSQQHLLL